MMTGVKAKNKALAYKARDRITCFYVKIEDPGED